MVASPGAGNIDTTITSTLSLCCYTATHQYRSKEPPFPLSSTPRYLESGLGVFGVGNQYLLSMILGFKIIKYHSHPAGENWLFCTGFVRRGNLNAFKRIPLFLAHRKFLSRYNTFNTLSLSTISLYVDKKRALHIEAWVVPLCRWQGDLGHPEVGPHHAHHAAPEPPPAAAQRHPQQPVVPAELRDVLSTNQR